MGDMESSSRMVLHSFARGLGGDQEAGELGCGVGEAGESRHAVQLLNLQGHHVDAQGIDEALHTFLSVWPRLFRRLSHLSEREELMPDVDTLSSLS